MKNMNLSIGKIVIIGIFGVIIIAILAAALVITSPVWGAIVLIDILRGGKKRKEKKAKEPAPVRMISDEAKTLSHEDNQ